MTQVQTMPKGRTTIRRTSNGLPARRIRLWECETKPGTIIEKLEKAYLDSLSAVDATVTKRQQLAGDTRYTDAGAEEQFASFVFAELIPVFAKGRHTVEQGQQALADMRAKLRLPKADPTDAAGAIERMEIRTWLRTLPQAERDKITRPGPSALDPQIRQAIIEMPAEMTKVAGSHRGLILESVMRETHGPLLDEIDELSRAVEACASAVDAGRDEIRIESGIRDPREFDRRAAEVEKKIGVPWLRKQGDRVIVVDMETRTTHPATPEEIETGVYYTDHAEFSKYNAA